MKTNPFKIFFIILSVMIGLIMAFSFFAVGSVMISGNPDGSEIHVITFPVVAAFIIVIVAIMALIAILVFRDAKKRGMNPWLWATVATFVPNLLGVVIYLIVRYTFKTPCPSCGHGLQGDFNICPYCGAKLKVNCPSCGKEVSDEWKICPYCGDSLIPVPGPTEGEN